MHVRIRDGEVEEVQLRIYEPPRFFEALLRGRRYTEPPDITARICGICPVAYQMSACAAVEDACGVDGRRADPRAASPDLLRRVDREPRAARVHAARARLPRLRERDRRWPRDHREIVERGLRMKKAGNAIITLVGGREVHPINVRVGGFWRAPSQARAARRWPSGSKEARELALETVRWTSTLDFPELDEDYEFVALSHPEDYPLERGRLVSSRGLDIGPGEYEEHFVEEHVPHSTALHSRLRERGSYLVGPLARYALSSDRLSPLAREAAREAGLDRGLPQPVPEHRGAQRRDPLRVRRGAADHRRLRGAGPSGRRGRRRGRAPASAGPRRREGCCGTATRSTSRARSSTRRSCRRRRRTSARSRRTCSPLVRRNLELDDEPLRLRCEQAIRNYDPCISCATHFLDARGRSRLTAW